MSVFVECKPDEMLVYSLGIPRRDIEHALGRASVCAQLCRRSNHLGMVDEDPNTVPPPYLKHLEQESWAHGLRVMFDKERCNRLIMLSPRLEEWLVRAAKEAGVKLSDFGFESDNGIQLHSEINQRLGSLEKLVVELLLRKSPRLLALQALLKADF